MKFTYNWLRDFIDTPLSAQEVADQLMLLGFEVEDFFSTLPSLDGILVAKVIACQPLPKSDHLKLCQVDIGSERLEVVCGAPNVASEQWVAFAPPGTTLSSGMQIGERKIHGVVSRGMICSEHELGLSDEADGILVLDHQKAAGALLRDVLEQDWVIDISVTTNRPDALGIIGIAREVGLRTGTPLKLPKIRLSETKQALNKLVKIRIDDAQGCPRYATRLLQNVEVKPSPNWMVKRLNAVGIRAISNLVDVSNYVMMETGQPLHAFDFDTLDQSTIIVRRATAGEKFTTLDDREHELRANDLLICDASKPVALAGVMGGLNSEVKDTTRNVLIECAHFEPISVRRTGKRLGIASEAGRRFERGTDPNNIPFVLNRTAQLMQMTAGGEIVRGIAEAYPKPIKPAKVEFRPKRVTHVLGIKVPNAKMEKILTGLECKVNKKNPAQWQVTTPTFRPDLTREIDLVEEVARVHGYEHITERLHSLVPIDTETNRDEIVIEKIRQAMTGLGLDEAVTFDLIAQKHAPLFLPPQTEALTLVNPLNEDLTTLRPSLLASMLHSLAYNLNRKNRNVWLYEIGSAFWKTNTQPICEAQRLAAVAVGAAEMGSWLGAGRNLSAHDIRGLLEVLAQQLCWPQPEFKPITEHAYFEYGWQIEINGKPRGYAGKLQNAILKTYEVEVPAFGFEIDLQDAVSLVDWNRTLQPIPKFPASERDIAVVVEADMPAGKIASVIQSSGGVYLEKFEQFDLYTGNQIPQGKKSLAYALVFRAADRTLRDAEVEEAMQNIIAELRKQCSAELRK